MKLNDMFGDLPSYNPSMDCYKVCRDRILKLTREQRELLLEYAIHMLEEAEK